MLSIDRRSLQNFDWLLLLLTLLLLGIGLVNLFSATQAGSEGGLPSEFRRQLAALALASIGLTVALLVDYRRTERMAIPFYLATLLLCASTLVFAPVVRGSRSWLLWNTGSLVAPKNIASAKTSTPSRWSIISAWIKEYAERSFSLRIIPLRSNSPC